MLVLNCGSSSVKADVLDPETGERFVRERVERIDGDHAAALATLLPRLVERSPAGALSSVGHRVVHGGAQYSRPVLIDDVVEGHIEALIPLAPLHNPANLAGIRAARRLLPDVPHVAVFDTAFHATMPARARSYALPTEVVQAHGIRRYGFHGPSHAWVAARAAEHLDEPVRALRIVTCHLGNGCSVAAVEYGRSVETSMGMTPLEGLVMGTRSGDVDPGALIALLRSGDLDVDGLDELLQRSSGLAGLSGRGNDMRDIEDGAADGDERCRTALHVFCHRVRKYVGAYAAVMGGVDAIVFTAGIGQNSALVRHRVAQRLEFLGARLDEDLNRQARVDRAAPVAEISAPHSRCRLLVVATDEEHAIAQQVRRMLDARAPADVAKPPPIPVAISARHVHLTQEHVEALFGAGATLTVDREISQPGQFAAVERVDLVGPRRRIDRVRIIGPVRSRTQVEIARTDEFRLGLDAPIRGSGDLDNTPGIRLEGPAGSVTLREGVICSQRHIHMRPEDAERYGVEHKDVVEVAIDSQGRDLVFADVLVRVSAKYALEMHIDTDEGNAAEVTRGFEAVFHRTDKLASLRLQRPTSGAGAAAGPDGGSMR